MYCISYNFDVYASAIEFNIPTQLVVRFPLVVEDTSTSGLITCIWCMVVTLDLFICSFVS